MSVSTWLRRVATAAAVGALLVPVIRNEDSFPLSTQPMYATARDAFAWLPSARGVDGGTGEQFRLSMAIVAQTDDPLIAKSRLEQAIRSDRARTLCEEIATRVAAEPELMRINLIEVVAEYVDLVAFVTDDAAALDAQVHGRCEVRR
jgi:hypothetical protein